VTRKAKHLVMGAMALIVLSLVAAGGVFALHGGVSMYMAQRVNDGRHTTISNPTGKEMFALAINYDESENFDNCQGFILSPSDVDDFHSGPDEGFTQIISVPTSGTPNLAKHHNLGLIARNGHRNFFLIDPVLFKFEDSNVAACARCELENFSLPRGLLAPFGVSASGPSCS
jgi:hypothetical protein